MPPALDPQTAEKRARDLLDARITSVRALAVARAHIADLRAQLADAERADVTAYNTALRDGWAPDELRTLGLGEPAKTTRVRQRAARKAQTQPAETGD